MYDADMEPEPPSCGLTELFRGTDIASPLPELSQSAKVLNFSQTTYMMGCESQEFRTQDFETPVHGAGFNASQASQRQVPILGVGAPPTFNHNAKRGRLNFEPTPGVPLGAEETTPAAFEAQSEDLRGCKKIKKLTGNSSSPATDLKSASACEWDDLDVDRLLRQHAIPAGSRGSFSHTFQELGKLGQGEFGQVVHARHKLDLTECAIKATAERQILADDVVKRVLLEGQVMGALHAACRSASVPGFCGLWIEAAPYMHSVCHRLFLRMELCGESLAAVKAREGRLGEARLTCVLNQVSGVLAALHDLGFAHLDVKPANILVSRRDADLFKLCDYGCVARLDGALDVGDGDRQYLPTEMLAGDHSSLAESDIFSLGIALFELASGADLPHDGDEYTALRHGHIPSVSGLSRSFQELLIRMMHPKPSHRPAAGELAKWRPQQSDGGNGAGASSGSRQAGSEARSALGDLQHGGGGLALTSRHSQQGRGSSAGAGIGDKLKLAAAGKDAKRRAGDSKPGKRAAAPRTQTLTLSKIFEKV